MLTALLLALSLTVIAPTGGLDEPIPINKINFTPACSTLTFDDGSLDIHLGTVYLGEVDPALVSSQATEPLEPSCNTCMVGTYCIVNVGRPPFEPVLDCCNGTQGNCLKCSICKIRPIDGNPTVDPVTP